MPIAIQKPIENKHNNKKFQKKKNQQFFFLAVTQIPFYEDFAANVLLGSGISALTTTAAAAYTGTLNRKPRKKK